MFCPVKQWMFQEENDDYVVFLLEYAASSMQHTLWMYSIFVLELKVDGRNMEFFQVLESKVCNFIMPQILDSPEILRGFRGCQPWKLTLALCFFIVAGRQ